MVDSSLENVALSTDGGLYAHRIAIRFIIHVNIQQNTLKRLFRFSPPDRSNIIPNVNNHAFPSFDAVIPV